jgi:hypothetical protein
MAKKYFYAQGATQHGPYSAAQMRGLAAQGQIRPTDLVWREGKENRVPASGVRTLFSGAHGPDGAGANGGL